MYQGIAAIGIDQQPIDGANPWLALFFVVFIVIGGFFVLQLFVATTIEKVRCNAQQAQALMQQLLQSCRYACGPGCTDDLFVHG